MEMATKSTEVLLFKWLSWEGWKIDEWRKKIGNAEKQCGKSIKIVISLQLAAIVVVTKKIAHYIRLIKQLEK